MMVDEEIWSNEVDVNFKLCLEPFFIWVSYLWKIWDLCAGVADISQCVQ